MPNSYWEPPPDREIPGLKTLGQEYKGVSDEKLEEYQVLGSRIFTELATGTRDYSTFVSCAPPRNIAHSAAVTVHRLLCSFPVMCRSCPTVTLWSLLRDFA